MVTSRIKQSHYGPRPGTLAVLAVALVAGGITSGCTGTSTSNSKAACTTALNNLADWLNSNSSAEIAENNALLDFTNYLNGLSGLPSSTSATNAINTFNSESTQAKSDKAAAQQKLATYQESLKSCKQSSLPKPCQSAISQVPTAVDIDARSNKAHDAAFQSVASIEKAISDRNLSALKASKSSYNAAIDDYNAAENDNKAWYATANTTWQQCKTELGG